MKKMFVHQPAAETEQNVDQLELSDSPLQSPRIDIRSVQNFFICRVAPTHIRKKITPHQSSF
jgi:hypothetical protein